MRLFARKPRKFNYAAIRIGNVYVLPPDEDDVRAFHRKRRKELTRRGFLVGGVVAALGGVAWLVLPGRKPAPDPRMLLDIDPATADKDLLKELTVAYFHHPDPEIRFQCARLMAALPEDLEVKDCLWSIVHDDPVQRNREKAIDSLIQHADPGDIAAIADQYQKDPSLRSTIDLAVDALNYRGLRAAIKARAGR